MYPLAYGPQRQVIDIIIIEKDIIDNLLCKNRM